VWDVATGAPIGIPMRHDGPVSDARFSVDGARVVTAGGGTEVTLISNTGTVVKPLRDVDWAPIPESRVDGRQSMISSGDAAQVWDVATGIPVGSAMPHEGWVRSVAFSPDSARVVTASYDKTARIWLAPPVAPNIIATACKMLGSNHDTNGLSEGYGVRIADPICGPDTPTPDPSRMVNH
jgi:WD40 repeat protein